MTNIESKHGIVSRNPYEMYMALTDLSNLRRMLPEDKQNMVTADFDTLSATVQGFHVGVKVHQRVPYSRIELVDYDAPFAFRLVLHFDPAPGDAYKTDFSMALEADLNMMMKMMLSKKLKEGLDQVVDGLVDASNGKMPEGFNPDQWAR